jgi:hypothetical protein
MDLSEAIGLSADDFGLSADEFGLSADELDLTRGAIDLSVDKIHLRNFGFAQRTGSFSILNGVISVCWMENCLRSDLCVLAP